MPSSVCRQLVAIALIRLETKPSQNAKMEMLVTRPPEKLYMMSCNDLCSKFYADSHGANEKASIFFEVLGLGVEGWRLG